MDDLSFDQYKEKLHNLLNRYDKSNNNLSIKIRKILDKLFEIRDQKSSILSESMEMHKDIRLMTSDEIINLEKYIKENNNDYYNSHKDSYIKFFRNITEAIKLISEYNISNMSAEQVIESADQVSVNGQEVINKLDAFNKRLQKHNERLVRILGAIVNLNLTHTNVTAQNVASNNKLQEEIRIINDAHSATQAQINAQLKAATEGKSVVDKKILELEALNAILKDECIQNIQTEELKNAALKAENDANKEFIKKISKIINSETFDLKDLSEIESELNIINVPESSGGFNWRTAAESKKLMSSKSSNKFLREKDNHSKKLRKSSKTSQNMKSKKKKKGIFRNLGLFRKNKK